MIIYLEAALIYWLFCLVLVRRAGRAREEAGPLCRPLTCPTPTIPTTTRSLLLPRHPTAPAARPGPGEELRRQPCAARASTSRCDAARSSALIGPSGLGQDDGAALAERPRDARRRACSSSRTARRDRLRRSRRRSRSDRAALRDRSAMVFQHHNLFPHLTVLENVIEGPVQAQRVPKATADRSAPRSCSTASVSPRSATPTRFELSGGQQQRVGIVRALALAARPAALRRADEGARPRARGRGARGAEGARGRGLDDGHRHARARIRARGRGRGALSSTTASSSSAAPRRRC